MEDLPSEYTDSDVSDSDSEDGSFLPIEVVSKIFEYVQSGVLITVSLHPQLKWLTYEGNVLGFLDFVPTKEFKWPEVCQFVSCKGRKGRIRKIKFSDFGSMGPQLSDLFRNKWRCLTFLNVSHCDLTEREILYIGSKLPTLQDMVYSTFINWCQFQLVYPYKNNLVLGIRKLTVDCLCTYFSEVKLKQHLLYISFPKLENLHIRVHHFVLNSRILRGTPCFGSFSSFTMNHEEDPNDPGQYTKLTPNDFPSLKNFFVTMNPHITALPSAEAAKPLTLDNCIVDNFTSFFDAILKRRRKKAQTASGSETREFARPISQTLHFTKAILKSKPLGLSNWIAHEGRSALKKLSLSGWNCATKILEHQRANEMNLYLSALLQDVIDWCPNIRELILEETTKNEQNINYLLGQFARLDKLMILDYPETTNIDPGKTAIDVNQDSLTKFLKFTRVKLQELDIRLGVGRKCFPDNDYRFIERFTNLRCLTVLRAREIHGKCFLKSIARHCPALESLRLSYLEEENFNYRCRQLTAILPLMKNLKELVFHHSELRMIKRFWLTLRGMPLLRDICLGSNAMHAINAQFVEQFICHAKHLEVLHIHSKLCNYSKAHKKILDFGRTNNLVECIVQDISSGNESATIEKVHTWMQHRGYFRYKKRLCTISSNIATGKQIFKTA